MTSDTRILSDINLHPIHKLQFFNADMKQVQQLIYSVLT